MKYEWDAAKAKVNAAKHGVSFNKTERFEWDSALVIEDRRIDYGENRYIATGFIGDRLHVLVYTLRGGNTRIIGLRKANATEVKRYEQTQTR